MIDKNIVSEIVNAVSWNFQRIYVEYWNSDNPIY